MPPDKDPQPIAWSDLLAAVTSPEEVVRVARDFVATWTPQEIAALPRACRPPGLKFPEQVVDYAFTLVRARVDSPSQNDAVTRMADFFAEASWRVAAAMSAVEAAQSDNDRAY